MGPVVRHGRLVPLYSVCVCTVLSSTGCDGSTKGMVKEREVRLHDVFTHLGSVILNIFKETDDYDNKSGIYLY